MTNITEAELIEGLKELPNYNPDYKRPELKADKRVEENIEKTLPTTEPVTKTEVESENNLDDTMVIVKVAGEDVEISIKELKNGYMKQSDYTRKTQELAGLKDEYSKALMRAEKAIEAVTSNIHNPSFREKEYQLKSRLDNVDWDKATPTELSEMIRVRLQYEKLKQENDNYLNELEKTRTAMKQEAMDYKNKLKSEEKSKLLNIVPELLDEAQSKEMYIKIKGYLQTRFGAEKVQLILENICDHRDFLTLRDAMIGNDYLTNKLPKKSVIKLSKKIDNDGLKDSSLDTSRKTLANRALQSVKSRGDRAAATKEELMTILAGKI